VEDALEELQKWEDREIQPVGEREGEGGLGFMKADVEEEVQTSSMQAEEQDLDRCF
jgi:hypothetical protein